MAARSPAQTTAGIFRLDNSVMDYAWGSFSAIARLQGRAPGSRPEAELWMGAHPKAPSRLVSDTEEVLLDSAISHDPQALLGQRCAAAFGRLPFLFKLLAAHRPLSIQAHPSLEQAAAGFAREELAGIDRKAPTRTYRDENHKPELLCAVSDFEALCGLRTPTQIKALFNQLSLDSVAAVAKALATLDTDSGLKQLFAKLLQDAEFSRTLTPLVIDACARLGAATEFSDSCRWALKLAEYYPDDVGVTVSLMLNYVKLRPGQALYLPAGVLHCYLGGLAMELMANSDNVIRGGLTPKYVDVAELLQVVEFGQTGVQVLEPQRENEHTLRYPTPAREFELRQIHLDDDRLDLAVTSPQILFVIEGDVTLYANERELQLERGQSAFVAGSCEQLSLEGPGDVYCASVPSGD